MLVTGKPCKARYSLPDPEVQYLGVQILVEAVGASLGLHEDEGPVGLAVEVLGPQSGGSHQVEQEVPLVPLLHPDDLQEKGLQEQEAETAPSG
jgi:hypothetical protein